MSSVELAHHTPIAVAPLWRFMQAHAVVGLDHVEPDRRRLTRLLPTAGGGAVAATIDVDAEPRLTLDSPALTIDESAVAAVRRWLDLDLDPTGPDEALAADPDLAPLVAARPGLRVPGSVDGFETLVMVILGQQVSLGAARTFAARLVAGYGAPHESGLSQFPTPEALAAAGPGAIQRVVATTGARAATIHRVAVAVADGLDLSPSADPDVVRSQLLALPGIGEWTVAAVAMRVLRDPDAFLATDLVLLRELGVKTGRQAIARAEAWRPWRAYALMHLWTRAVFA